MAELGAALFAPGDRALTHCNTGPLATAGYGTAGGVLRAAWEDGRLEEVWVDETRPLLQGARLTAYELERAGIPFRLITDSSAGTLMARGLVDRIVVGADRIAANGDVANKVGTYPLAVLAARHAVPFYVVAPLSTIDPETAAGGDIPIEERDAAEVAAACARPEPRLRRDARRAGDGDRHRGGRAGAPLPGGDRRCPWPLTSSRPRQEMLRLGLVSGSSGNVSVREGELVHITPAGLPYEQMTAADVVTLALDGSVVAGAREPSSERRVHLAVYAARARRRGAGAHAQRARHRVELSRRAAGDGSRGLAPPDPR